MKITMYTIKSPLYIVKTFPLEALFDIWSERQEHNAASVLLLVPETLFAYCVNDKYLLILRPSLSVQTTLLEMSE